MLSKARRVAVSSAGLAMVVGLVWSAVAWPQGVQQSTAAAQGVVPGAWARWVTAASDTSQIGTITDVRPDGFSFRREGQGDNAPIGFASLTRLDISKGRHAHPLLGLGIGVVAGAGIGAIVGAASYHSCSNCLSLGQGLNVGGGAIVGAGAGAVVGLVTGFIVRTERWHKVPLGSLLAQGHTSLIVTPSPTGIRLGLRIGAPI